MPSKRPTKADRMIVANFLRAEATMLRSAAEINRATTSSGPDVAETLRRFAAQKETRAQRFERIADWMVGV